MSTEAVSAAAAASVGVAKAATSSYVAVAGAVMFAAAVSVLAVVIGFRFAPLRPGHELEDAGNRLAAGLLSSFTIGPGIAFAALHYFPALINPWLKIFPEDMVLLAYLAAATPFIAFSGIAGFWLVAVFVKTMQDTQGKSAADLAREAAKLGKDVLP